VKRIAAPWITSLSVLTALMALPATLVGIFTSAGHRHQQFVSLWNETVAIQGGGLYRHESVSEAAQGVGLDVVTLVEQLAGC
jgi:hypothetical protein